MHARMMLSPAPGPLRPAALALLTLIGWAPHSAGQTIEYELTPIGLLAGAFSTVGTGVNSHGTVVGWAQGEGALTVAFMWTAEDGLIELPNPPAFSSSTAMDISDTGVIVGVAWSPGREAWRLEDAAYTMLGTLPDYFESEAWGVNDLGQVVGFASDFNFFNNKAIFHSDATGMIDIAFGAATRINNAGQVTGWTSENHAFRWSPGGGLEILGQADASYPLNWGFGINDQGDIVGNTSLANGNNDRPFLFTDGGGMQFLEDAGIGNVAADINNDGAIIGGQTTTGAPWILPPGDLDGDCTVGITDVLILLANWG